jgi:hypothetical protein
MHLNALDGSMVSTCAGCKAPFLYWGTGKLFQFERRKGDSELYWVCTACLERIHLIQDREGNILAVPIRRAA